MIEMLDYFDIKIFAFNYKIKDQNEIIKFYEKVIYCARIIFVLNLIPANKQ